MSDPADDADANDEFGDDAIESRIVVRNPYVIIYTEPDDNIAINIHPPTGMTIEHYAILVCYLISHIAETYKIEEDAVWNAVEAERELPSTDVDLP